jgi:uncharacterized protein (UPF0212 family)
MQVNCSACNRSLKPIGSIQDDILRRGGIAVGGTSTDFQQWLGTVCSDCGLIFCDSCREPKPGLCPLCGQDLKPAMASYIPQTLTKVLVKSETFSAKSLEEAVSTSRKEIPPNLILKEDIQDVETKVRTESGVSADEAIQAAKAVPLGPVCYDVSPIEIVQEAQQGSSIVQAFSEDNARQAWIEQGQAPWDASIVSIDCESAASKGFAGIGKKEGTWRINWTTPFKARFSYKLPAIVTVHYIKLNQ